MLKRLIALAAVLAVFIPFITPFGALAAEAEYIFVDGENITRQTNSLVIYSGIPTTGQSKWGFDVIFDAEGKIIKTVEAGDGEDLAIPEGCKVASASGDAATELKSKAKTGKYIYYDAFSQRLFITSKKDGYDPYYDIKLKVYSSSEGNYVIASPGIEGTPQYRYTVIADQNGMVVDRGSGIKKNDGYITVSAATESDMKLLIMYGIPGSELKIENGEANFRFTEKMLSRGLTVAIDGALNTASDFMADESVLDIFDEAQELASDKKLKYEAALDMLYKIERAKPLLSENKNGELRAAFYTPTEKTKEDVEKTVARMVGCNLNAVILRVSNGYGTCAVTPAGSRFSQDSKFGGFDVIAAFVDVCKQNNIEIDLCIDVYYNAYASAAAPEWLAIPSGSEDAAGKKFFSPANDDFKAYYLEYLKGIIKRYEINGLYFDSLRYPKFSETGDIGFDSNTVDKFCSLYGVKSTEAAAIKTELFKSKYWNQWLEYKKGLVSDMARSISEVVRENRKDLVINVIAARDTVDYYYCQDCRVWIGENLFDGVTLALFDSDASENNDIPLLAYGESFVESKATPIAAYTGKNKIFNVALDTAAPKSETTIENEIVAARKSGADGIILSSFESYLAQNYGLETTVFAEKAARISSDHKNSALFIIEKAKDKIEKAITLQDGGDEAMRDAALNAIEKAIQKISSEEFGHTEAASLESEIAMIFAKSAYKAEVVKEFSAVTKMMLIAENRSGEPNIDIPNDSSSPDESDISNEASEAISSTESQDTQSGGKEEQTSTASEEKGGIQIGTVVAFAFVSIALIACVIGTVTAIKRRKKPKKRYKLSGDDTENE